VEPASVAGFCGSGSLLGSLISLMRPDVPEAASLIKAEPSLTKEPSLVEPDLRAARRWVWCARLSALSAAVLVLFSAGSSTFLRPSSSSHPFVSAPAGSDSASAGSIFDDGGLPSSLSASPPLAWVSAARPLASFDPACGHIGQVKRCPGFTECSLAHMGVSEAEFLRAQRAQFAGEMKPSAAPTPLCTRTNCMDTSRCQLPFKFYVYNATRLKAAGVADSLLRCIGKSFQWDQASQGMLTDDPARACLYWLDVSVSKYVNVGKCRKMRMGLLPTWNNGLNHVVWETTDHGLPARQVRRYLGRAALAQGFSTTGTNI
jgi:hypothetical protein